MSFLPIFHVSLHHDDDGTQAVIERVGPTRRHPDGCVVTITGVALHKRGVDRNDTARRAIADAKVGLRACLALKGGK